MVRAGYAGHHPEFLCQSPRTLSTAKLSGPSCLTEGRAVTRSSFFHLLTSLMPLKARKPGRYIQLGGLRGKSAQPHMEGKFSSFLLIGTHDRGPRSLNSLRSSPQRFLRVAWGEGVCAQGLTCPVA